MVTMIFPIREEYYTKLREVAYKMGNAVTVDDYAQELLEKAIEDAYNDFVLGSEK